MPEGGRYNSLVPIQQKNTVTFTIVKRIRDYRYLELTPEKQRPMIFLMFHHGYRREKADFTFWSSRYPSPEASRIQRDGEGRVGFCKSLMENVQIEWCHSKGCSGLQSAVIRQLITKSCKWFTIIWATTKNVLKKADRKQFNSTVQ